MKKSIRKKTLLKMIRQEHCYGNCSLVNGRKSFECPLLRKACCSTVTKRVNNMNFKTPEFKQAAIDLYLKHFDIESLFGVLL